MGERVWLQYSTTHVCKQRRSDYGVDPDSGRGNVEQLALHWNAIQEKGMRVGGGRKLKVGSASPTYYPRFFSNRQKSTGSNRQHTLTMNSNHQCIMHPTNVLYCLIHFVRSRPSENRSYHSIEYFQCFAYTGTPLA
jgi:hypothetical protein